MIVKTVTVAYYSSLLAAYCHIKVVTNIGLGGSTPSHKVTTTIKSQIFLPSPPFRHNVSTNIFG